MHIDVTKTGLLMVRVLVMTEPFPGSMFDR